ncbi:hypothetical protein EPO17_00415 [Patescibacteria group bacterium]|nr:MAG: hypothetical protein EPO17_00415 [Patescibacteria group bacterium]
MNVDKCRKLVADIFSALARFFDALMSVLSVIFILMGWGGILLSALMLHNGAPFGVAMTGAILSFGIIAAASKLR